MLFEADEKIAALRSPRFPKIRDQIADLHRFHAAAHDLGLKVVLFSYEPSIPAEIVEAYPEALYPYPKAFLERVPDEAETRHVCIFDERVQEWVAQKAAETIRNIGPLDAWMYTTNETMLRAGLTYHVCERCYDEPRWMALRLLRDAMLEGARRAGQDVTMIHRYWGTHHTDDQRNTSRYMKDVLPYHHDLQAAMAETVQSRTWRASRDIPPFAATLEEEPGTPWVTSKATWTDFLLHQPLNPWVGHSRGKVKEIIELSLEPCFQQLYGFVPCIMLRQLQRQLQYAVERGCTGVNITPIEADTDWELNQANLEVALRLIDDPDADVARLLKTWTGETYGAEFPGWLVDGLLDTETIWATVCAYNGISNLVNFDMALCPLSYTLGLSKFYLYPLFEAFPDAKERFNLGQEGLGRALSGWNEAVGKAHALNERVKEAIDDLPEPARAHLIHFFDRLALWTLWVSLHQKLMFTRMALEMKKIEPSMTLTRLTERWDYQLYYLLANDEDIRRTGYTGYYENRVMQGGWCYPDLAEADAFPGIREHKETLVAKHE